MRKVTQETVGEFYWTEPLAKVAVKSAISQKKLIQILPKEISDTKELLIKVFYDHPPSFVVNAGISRHA